MTKTPSCDNVSQPESLNEMVRRLNQETQAEGEKWFQENRSISFLAVFLKAKFIFIRSYFFQGGILKGYSGFIQSIHNSLFQILSYAKYWELTERQRGKM